MSFVSLDGIKEKELLPGIKVRFIHSDNMTVAYWDINEGAIFPEHSHPHEQIANIVEGEFEFKVGDEKRIMKKGDVAVIPPNVKHTGKALTRCKAIDLFYPVREDYK